jgi:Sec-independent protein secretion pathway component TatC
VFAALATPGGDIVSPIVLGGTMYLLFELTVVAISRSGK